MGNLTARTKFKLLVILGFLQVWFWPMWFAYVVGSSPVAVSSFFTMVGLAIWNVICCIGAHDKVDWEDTLDRARTRARMERM
jgi:hypothetical protein